MGVETPTATDANVDVANVVVSVGAAAVSGLYAAWIAAGLLSRWFVFPLVTATVGYVLYAKTDGHETVAWACYVLAGLVAVTPVFVVLPDVLAADRYGVSAWALAVTIGNLILLVFFAIPAAVLAYVGYRLDGGRGVSERLRDRLAR